MARILVNPKEFIDLSLLILLMAMADDTIERSDLADDTLLRMVNAKTVLTRHSLEVDPRIRQLFRIISGPFRGSMEHSVIEIMKGQTNEGRIKNTCEKYLFKEEE